MREEHVVPHVRRLGVAWLVRECLDEGRGDHDLLGVHLRDAVASRLKCVRREGIEGFRASGRLRALRLRALRALRAQAEGAEAEGGRLSPWAEGAQGFRAEPQGPWPWTMEVLLKPSML